jgi:hypothetical protein
MMYLKASRVLTVADSSFLMWRLYPATSALRMGVSLG